MKCKHDLGFLWVFESGKISCFSGGTVSSRRVMIMRLTKIIFQLLKAAAKIGTIVHILAKFET